MTLSSLIKEQLGKGRDVYFYSFDSVNRHIYVKLSTSTQKLERAVSEEQLQFSRLDVLQETLETMIIEFDNAEHREEHQDTQSS